MKRRFTNMNRKIYKADIYTDRTKAFEVELENDVIIGIYMISATEARIYLRTNNEDGISVNYKRFSIWDANLENQQGESFVLIAGTKRSIDDTVYTASRDLVTILIEAGEEAMYYVQIWTSESGRSTKIITEKLIYIDQPLIVIPT